MTNYARYIGLLLEAMPELRATVEREEEVYSRTHAFVDFVNDAIYAGDWPTVRKGYGLVNRVLGSDPDDEVHNALCVSFIEHLDFSHTTNGPKAKELLPQRLLDEWESLEQYWKENAPKAMKAPKKTSAKKSPKKRSSGKMTSRRRGKHRR